MKHTAKIKLARKMRSKAEIRFGVPIFQSRAWEERSNNRHKKEMAKFI